MKGSTAPCLLKFSTSPRTKSTLAPPPSNPSAWLPASMFNPFLMANSPPLPAQPSPSHTLTMAMSKTCQTPCPIQFTLSVRLSPLAFPPALMSFTPAVWSAIPKAASSAAKPSAVPPPPFSLLCINLRCKTIQERRLNHGL